MSDNKIKGRCFFGAVEFEVKGEPTAMVYCHCKDCQAWSAGPINSASLWNPDLLEITNGQEYIETYNKTEDSYRKF